MTLEENDGRIKSDNRPIRSLKMSKVTAEMTVAEAIASHPRAREVFAGYHLGGCSHCSISDFETVAQVCEGYGVPVEALLDSINSLPETDEKP